MTSRRGNVTSSSRDGFNRLTQLTYADTSTTSYTYDLADRITQATDSVTGTLSFVYDGLDRITSQTSPQGTITDTSNPVELATRMQEPVSPLISYISPSATSLPQITQGT